MKLRLQELQGDAMFGGHDRALGELVTLSDQAIRYTRGLTFELSPPVLYELGLGPALDWLGEQFAAQARPAGRGEANTARRDLRTTCKVLLWKCARELVHNVVKHAQARRVTIELAIRRGPRRLWSSDDGWASIRRGPAR